MPRIDNEKFYKSAIEMYGTTAKGVNWYSKENQRIRFDMILKLLPKEISNFSIIDAGCGFGDLYIYLEKKKRLPKLYTGIDSLLDMYSIASEQTGQNIIIADIIKDELPKAHYYICSGAMNVLSEFETHLFMRNCYKSSEIGFIFNILHGDKQSDTYNYLNTSKIQQIAKELNVSNLVLNDNYMENDITVGFFK